MRRLGGEGEEEGLCYILVPSSKQKLAALPPPACPGFGLGVGVAAAGFLFRRFPRKTTTGRHDCHFLCSGCPVLPTAHFGH
jgi:hypothetical protein